MVENPLLIVNLHFQVSSLFETWNFLPTLEDSSKSVVFFLGGDSLRVKTHRQNGTKSNFLPLKAWVAEFLMM